MEYRRFGCTDKNLSVITLGGMRLKHGWKGLRSDELLPETVEHCRNVVQMALDHGINHIETAYGYKKSERAFGIVLNNVLNVPRNSYHLMTKGDPKTADETRRMVEEQLTDLKTDFFDFYAWHGMNNQERTEIALSKGGPVEELLKLKEEGVIKHVGFSTHAPLEIILRVIDTGCFEFINLHYYYFFQRNYAAIALAEQKGMGVFIISPNDKGGHLFNAPQKIKDIVEPATPIQFNARFCLGHSAIHTLSFGMTELSHFQEMDGIFPAIAPLSATDQHIKHKLDQLALADPFSGYDGYDLQNDPSGINIPEVLRFRKMLKCYDMRDFGLYRYNMFEENGFWFPGKFPTPERLEQIDYSKVPENIPLRKMIEETHRELFLPKE